MNYHAALAYFPKITYKRFSRLSAYFLKLENLWQSELDELIRSGLEENIAHEFIMWRESFDYEKMLAELEREKIATVSLGEKDYPRLLAEISDPPITLFIRGAKLTDDRPMVAIVGTRKCTIYGRQVSEEFSTQLAENGIGVVSGLALGVDGYAHAAALRAKGYTVAVLGSGVNSDHIYPGTHRALAQDIINSGGTIVSEYPPGFLPTAYSFPQRNRIIAGLTLGTLVTEAPTSSGALITTKCALDYNREVFAVPHNITSTMGMGGNNLIRMGAHLVTTGKDIIDILNIHQVKDLVVGGQTLPSNPTEAILIPLLSKEPRHIDIMIKESQLDSSVVSSALTIMEMTGKVRNLGGMMYIIR